MRTTVIHKRHQKPGDVYIGRPSIWGNPFEIGTDGTRQEVIAKYRDWITTQRPDLVEKAKRDLEGKRLVCWCAPQACHGDVLVSLIEKSIIADGRKFLEDLRSEKEAQANKENQTTGTTP